MKTQRQRQKHNKFINLRYLPKKLTNKDRKKQSQMLLKSRRLYKQKKYYTRKPVKSFQHKTSNHIVNARKLYKVEKIGATDELSKKSGCSKTALKKIISKGEGAYYSSGSRPGMTSHQWAMARVNAASPSKSWANVKKVGK